MKLLVLGQGAREHALAKQFIKSPLVNKVYCIPGNDGMLEDEIHCVSLSLDDHESLRNFAMKQQIDWTFVGPEKPLIDGIVDYFQQHNLKIFGPNQKAAQLEGSKSFAKQLMKKYQVPTAAYEVFTDYSAAANYVAAQSYPLVLKYDGLASGKGVLIVKNAAEAQEGLRSFYQNEVDTKVVIEEYLEGYEFSYHCLIAGNHVAPFITSQDYKRSNDGNQGKNTGGMGAFAPVPFATEEKQAQIKSDIIDPLLSGMTMEGITYEGVLYVGVMWTASGPKVIEFNVRFGDPETQVMLPLLKTDLVFAVDQLLQKRSVAFEWYPQKSVGVVVAAKGYPEPQVAKVKFDPLIPDKTEQQVFYAQVQQENHHFINEGGRIFTIQQIGLSYEEIRIDLYKALSSWRKDYSVFYRSDIAKKTADL